MVSLSRAGNARGPRPMNPLRDWGAVAQLMRVAFQTDAAYPRLPVLPDGPWNRWLNDLFGVFAAVGIESPEQMLGYVWEADGALVGNVTLGQSAAPAGIWLLSNVAVHPSHRRQGIARALVETAVIEARRRGGRWLTLQVQSDNRGARELYLRLGFRTVEALGEYAGADIAVPAPEERAIRLVRPLPEQWRAACGRARAHLPPSLYGYRHTLSGAFDAAHPRGWLGRLADLSGGTLQAAWCLLRGEHVAGGMTVQTQWAWGAHRAVLCVEPAAHGEVEELLLARALEDTGAFPMRRMHFAFPASHEAMAALLRARGLREVRALELMALEL